MTLTREKTVSEPDVLEEDETECDFCGLPVDDCTCDTDEDDGE